MKKPAVRKAASGRAARPKAETPQDRRPRPAAGPAKAAAARTPARPAPAKAPRAAATPAGGTALKHVVDQLDARLAGVERHFEQAKKSFEEASRARSTELGHGRQANKELNAHATELRLLTVRRTELLWLKRLLEGGAL